MIPKMGVYGKGNDSTYHTGIRDWILVMVN